MVERKVLALVVRSPAGKLPPALIDRQTGLAMNNLQAVCRLGKASSFCVVRPAQHIFIWDRGGRTPSRFSTRSMPEQGLRDVFRPQRRAVNLPEADLRDLRGRRG